MACLRKPKPFRIDPKVNKKQGYQPPIKLEISSFFGLEKLVFKLCHKNCQMRQRALCRKKWESTVIEGKNAIVCPLCENWRARFV